MEPPTPTAQPAIDADALRQEMIALAQEQGGKLVINNADFANKEYYPAFFESYPWLEVEGASIGGGTAGTVTRVVQEVNAGKSTFDLLFFDETGAAALEAAGALEKPIRPLPHLADFRDVAVAFDGIFIGAWMNPRVQGVYNTDLVPREDIPTSWDDFLDPTFKEKYKGKILLSRVSEEFPARLAWLFAEDGVWNWERAFEIVTAWSEMDPVFDTGYSTSQLTSRDRAMALYFPASRPARDAVQKGAPLGLIAFPEFPGTWRGFSIPRGAPNPAAAWLLLDYVTSPEGQRQYGELRGSQLPANTKAELGVLQEWGNAQGASWDNSKVIPAEESVTVNSPERLKRSEDFWFDLFGLSG